MSERRRLAVITLFERASEIDPPFVNQPATIFVAAYSPDVFGAPRVASTASSCRRRDVLENAARDHRIRAECEHAQRIAAVRALGDLVTENPAQQSCAIEPITPPPRPGGSRAGCARRCDVSVRTAC